MLGENDKKLIIEYLKGDEKSLELLIQQYLRPIYNFVYRYTGNVNEAEDITQEVFVRIWRNIKKFDLKKSFKTWIFSIAKNASIDFLRKKKSIPFSVFENGEGKNMLLETLFDTNLLPGELSERADMARTVNLAISELSPKYRAVLSLRHNNDFTFKEIAELLEERLNTVKSRYRRALIFLKKILS